MKKQNKFLSFLNNTITFLIVLVIIQTLLEDIAILKDFNYSTIIIIKIIGFIFDTIFTLEFIIRFIYSIAKKDVKKYFIYERGWIDLLASLPLLLFVSGPFMLRFFSISILSVEGLKTVPRLLKLIKIIRVAKILRFIRVLKIFGKIKNTKTQTTQRSVNYLSTIIVISIILFVFVIQILQTQNLIPSFEKTTYKNKLQLSQIFSRSIEEGEIKLPYYQEIMQIERNDKILYSSKDFTPDRQKEWNLITIDGYTVIDNNIKNTEYKFTYSNIDTMKLEAYVNIIIFSLILLEILVIAFMYARYFALTITDPIFVMKKGFEESEYTLAVKIPEKFKDNDDVFNLAKNYNEIWLPKKVKELNTNTPKESLLKFTDIFEDLDNPKSN